MAPGGERQGWRAAWQSSAPVLGYLWATVVLSHITPRLAGSLHQRTVSETSPWGYVLAGLALDVRDVLPLVLLVFLSSMGGMMLVRRDDGAQRLRIWLTCGLAFLSFALANVLMISAAEFKIERGILPTMFDASMGLGDFEFLSTMVHLLFMRRYVWPAIACTVVLGLATIVFVGSMRPGGIRLGQREIAILVGGTVALGAASFGFHRASPLMFSSIPDWKCVESYGGTFFQSLGTQYRNIRAGSRALFEHLKLPEEMNGPGASMLGLPASAAQRLSSKRDVNGCQPHPLREEFPWGGQGAHEELGPNADRAREIVMALEQLSSALFDGRDVPIHVWHVLLEGFRADDVQALHGAAPADIAPMANRLYRNAAQASPSVIASTKTYQAGVRTSENIAAATCGFGTMPFGLSFARDIGQLPTRCLPDLLKDASFTNTLYYGSNPAFDNMMAYLNYHGFPRLMTENDYLEAKPRLGWGVPDDYMMSQALDDAWKRTHESLQYNLVLTLTNHSPFIRPQGFPRKVGARVSKAVATSGRDIQQDDLARLELFSYTDWALERFLDKLESSPASAQSIALLIGDHSTGETFVWHDETKDPGDLLRARAQVMFAVVLPEALLRASRDEAESRKRIAKVNHLLSELPLSSNDTPRILLALLSAHRSLRTLPKELRWHTLGGQATSPWFHVRSRPEAAVMGLDATSKVFFVRGNDEAVPTEEAVANLHDPLQPQGVMPSMQPVAAFWSLFLRNYGNSCWGTENIRR